MPPKTTTTRVRICARMTAMRSSRLKTTTYTNRRQERLNQTINKIKDRLNMRSTTTTSRLCEVTMSENRTHCLSPDM